MSAAADHVPSPSRHESPANDAVDELIGMLKQPLTAIRAAAEILRDTPDLTAEQRDRFCEVVISDGERLSRLIDSCFANASVDGDRRKICLPVTTETRLD